MKGYIIYKVGHITFNREYVPNFSTLSESDIFIRFMNFKTGIIKSEEDNVILVFKGRVIAGNKDFK